MIITMTEKESDVFGAAVGNELGDLINEYDEDTGRRPSKKRYAKYGVLEAVRDKWAEQQRKTKLATGVEIIHLPANPCKLDLTKKEAAAVLELVRKSAEAEAFFPHLTEEVAAAKNVAEKLSAACNKPLNR